MHCFWCANPEGISRHSALSLNSNDDDTLDGIYHQDIENSYQTLNLDDVIEEAIECRPLFFDGGGVTLTGGEPTVQFEPVLELLKRLKGKEINTAIETNASLVELPKLFPYIDYLMMDIKHWDDIAHMHYTGLGTGTVIQNLDEAFNFGRNVAIRIPLINGVNSEDCDISGYLDLLKKYNPERYTIEFLPYHEYGKNKWVQRGMDYKIKDGKVTKNKLERFHSMFTAAGIRIIET